MTNHKCDLEPCCHRNICRVLAQRSKVSNSGPVLFLAPVNVFGQQGGRGLFNVLFLCNSSQTGACTVRKAFAIQVLILFIKSRFYFDHVPFSLGHIMTGETHFHKMDR